MNVSGTPSGGLCVGRGTGDAAFTCCFGVDLFGLYIDMDEASQNLPFPLGGPGSAPLLGPEGLPIHYPIEGSSSGNGGGGW